MQGTIISQYTKKDLEIYIIELEAVLASPYLDLDSRTRKSIEKDLKESKRELEEWKNRGVIINETKKSYDF